MEHVLPALHLCISITLTLDIEKTLLYKSEGYKTYVAFILYIVINHFSCKTNGLNQMLFQAQYLQLWFIFILKTFTNFYEVGIYEYVRTTKVFFFFGV